MSRLSAQQILELLISCSRDKQGCWDQFLDAFSDLIYTAIRKALAQCVLYSEQDFSAEDIFQDFFKKILDSKLAHKLIASKKPEAYLYICAYNHAMSTARQAQRYRRRVNLSLDESTSADLHEIITLDQGLDVPSPSLQSQVMNADHLLILDEAIDKLKPQDRELIQYYYFTGLTYQQIADLTDLNVNTLTSRLKKIVTSLRCECKFEDG